MSWRQARTATRRSRGTTGLSFRKRVHARIAGMQKHKPGPGRPSKGARLPFTVRVPAALAEAVRAEADDLEMSYSDHIANVLAEKYGHPQVARPHDQDQMRLTA